MPSGGARNRSGPRPDPRSGRSDARGVVFSALPSEGFQGSAPGFPLSSPLAREIEVWDAAWTTPQACAWSVQPWRWYTVAQWVRWSVKAEAEDASAAVLTAMIRLGDQVGMSPAGLKENGWAIAADEVAAKSRKRPSKASSGEKQPTRRLRAVNGDSPS